MCLCVCVSVYVCVLATMVPFQDVGECSVVIVRFCEQLSLGVFTKTRGEGDRVIKRNRRTGLGLFSSLLLQTALYDSRQLSGFFAIC